MSSLPWATFLLLLLSVPNYCWKNLKTKYLQDSHCHAQSIVSSKPRHHSKLLFFIVLPQLPASSFQVASRLHRLFTGSAQVSPSHFVSSAAKKAQLFACSPGCPKGAKCCVNWIDCDFNLQISKNSVCLILTLVKTLINICKVGVSLIEVTIHSLKFCFAKTNLLKEFWLRNRVLT